MDNNTQQMAALVVAGGVLICGVLILLWIIIRLAGRRDWLEQERDEGFKEQHEQWVRSLGLPPEPEGGWSNPDYNKWRGEYHKRTAALSNAPEEVWAQVDIEKIFEKKRKGEIK